MKPSELKQIIRETILENYDEVNRKLNQRFGLGTISGKGNIMRPKSDIFKKLGYDQLPATREKVTDFKKGIKLPDVYAGSSVTLHSKEEVADWFKKFKEVYKEEPEFETKMISGVEFIKITNPKFKEKEDISSQGAKSFGTKGT